MIAHDKPKAILLDVETVFGREAEHGDIAAITPLIKMAQDNNTRVALTWPDAEFFCMATEHDNFANAVTCFDDARKMITARKGQPDFDDTVRYLHDFIVADAPATRSLRDRAQHIAAQTGITDLLPRRDKDWHNHLEHVENKLAIPGEQTLCVVDDIRVRFVNGGHELCQDAGKLHDTVTRFCQKPGV